MSFDVSFFQIVASLALTLASVTVAIVSSYFTFRHNRGWKPIILVTTQARVGRGDEPSNLIFLRFEVWIRKYPIVIDEVTVTFSELHFIDSPDLEDEEVQIEKGNSHGTARIKRTRAITRSH